MPAQALQSNDTTTNPYQSPAIGHHHVLRAVVGRMHRPKVGGITRKSYLGSRRRSSFAAAAAAAAAVVDVVCWCCCLLLLLGVFPKGNDDIYIYIYIYNTFVCEKLSTVAVNRQTLVAVVAASRMELNEFCSSALIYEEKHTSL